MPSTSSISSAEKSTIKKQASSSTDKILSAAIGRIYYAHPDPSAWSWTGLEGAIVFGNTSKGKGGFWFKLVDISGSRGVIWQHEFYEEMQYHQDRTFFHTFAGDSCMIGFVFSEESEAAALYKKVINRAKHLPKKTELASSTSSGTASSLFSKIRKHAGPVEKNAISQPSQFNHVSHMGFDSEKGFTMENVDPSWGKLLEQLNSLGISEDQIRGNEDFIKQFVEQAGGAEAVTNATPVPAPSSRPPPPPSAPSPAVKSAMTIKRKPPPPRPEGRSDSISAPVAPPPPPVGAPSFIPPPPPPPPAMGRSTGPPAPPALPPGRSGPPPPPPGPPSRASVPPPPPAAAQRTGGPPPPPPPPGGRSSGPPPPPAPPAGGSLPPADAGRNNLLASIQGRGLKDLKKAEASRPSTPVASSPTTAAAPDLASTLAAALSQRKGKMADSDEEDEADEDW